MGFAKEIENDIDEKEQKRLIDKILKIEAKLEKTIDVEKIEKLKLKQQKILKKIMANLDHVETNEAVIGEEFITGQSSNMS